MCNFRLGMLTKLSIDILYNSSIDNLVFNIIKAIKKSLYT